MKSRGELLGGAVGYARRVRPARGNWRQNLYVLVGSHGLAILGFQISYVLMPLLVVEVGITDPGQAALWSGVILMMSPLLVGVVLPLWNLTAKRTGRKPQLFRATAANAVNLFLMGFAGSVGYLIATNASMGILGGSWPQTMMLATTGVPRTMVGQSVGLLQSVELIVSAFGPSLGGALGDMWGLRPNFFLGAGLNFIALLAIGLLYRPMHFGGASDEAIEDAEERPQEQGSLLDTLRLPGLLSLMGVFFLFQFFGPMALRGVVQVMVVDIAEQGAPVATLAGVTLSLSNITGAVAAQVVGRRGDRLGPGRLTVGLLGFAGLSVLATTLATSTEQLIVAWTIQGLATGGIITALYSLTGQVVPSESLGGAYALVSNALMLAALGRAVLGLVASVDLRIPFVLSGVVLLLLALWLAWLLRRMVPPGASQAEGANRRASAGCRRLRRSIC